MTQMYKPDAKELQRIISLPYKRNFGQYTWTTIYREIVNGYVHEHEVELNTGMVTTVSYPAKTTEIY